MLLVMLALPLIGAAQNYPGALMRVVVPYPPGGGTDILGRLLAQKLNESRGQPVMVDNRPGANGTVGTAFVAKGSRHNNLTILVKCVLVGHAG